KLLVPLLLQLLGGGEPLVLVHRVPREQEGEHVPDAMVVGHVVEPRHLDTTLHLGVGVGGEVGQQVAAGGDVAAAPGVAHAVDGTGSRAGDDGVLDVGAAHDGRDDRVGLDGLVGDPHGGL